MAPHVLSRLSPSRSTRVLRLAAFPAALLLAGCLQSTPFSGGAQDPTLAAPTTSVQSQDLPAAQTRSFGTGPVHVALILPLGSSVGQALRNAAELSLATAGGNEITVSVKDDNSSPEGARAAAQQALAEGDELIIGPLFANSVREVSTVARGAGKPVIAFSTDASSAARGVYLLSFLIEGYVDRIVAFAASRGKHSFAALVPNSDYGNVALAEFQQEAARAGVRVVTIERYGSGDLAGAAQRIAAASDTIDALFIPEQADGMGAVAQALTTAGLNPKHVQLLGTGVWNDARVLKLPIMQGAWFASPENSGFNAFAQRYRVKYGTEPARIASLAYDAVSLAAALARMQGGQRYTEQVFTNAQGFIGTDGVFRFHAEGTSERGLAIQQIGPGGPTVLNPAPRSFGSGT